MSKITKKRNRLKIILLALLAVLLIIVFMVLIFFTNRDRELFFSGYKTINIDGVDRKYLVYTPDKVSDNPKMIFAFHGLGSNGKQMAYLSAIHNSVDQNTIVVYPNALKSNDIKLRTGWNAVFCCGSGWKDKNPDLEFTQELVEKLSREYNISPKDRSAVGFSNGGMFVQRIAEVNPDLFSSYASVAGSIGTDEYKLKPVEPVRMLLIHGREDKVVPFEGGPGSTDNSIFWESFNDTLTSWNKANDCREIKRPINHELKDSSENTFIKESFDCEKRLKYIVKENEGHKWPDWRLFNPWNRISSGSEEIIDFVDSY